MSKHYYYIVDLKNTPLAQATLSEMLGKMDQGWLIEHQGVAGDRIVYILKDYA